MVHLLNDLFPKITDAMMGVSATCTITDGIITIVTECYVNDASLCKMLQVLDIVFYGQTIFYTNHDALFAKMFVYYQILRSLGKSDVITFRCDDVVDLVKYTVSILLGPHAFWYFSRFRMLWQIGNHSNSICTSFGHLM